MNQNGYNEAMDPKKSPSPISAAGLLGPDLVMSTKASNQPDESPCTLWTLNKCLGTKTCSPLAPIIDMRLVWCALILVRAVRVRKWSARRSERRMSGMTHLWRDPVQCISYIRTHPVTKWPEIGSYVCSQIPFYYSRIIALWQLSACDYFLAVSRGSHNIR